MRTIFPYFLFSMIILMSCRSFAGPVVNNGGGGWQCTIENQIAWIKTADQLEYDSWEWLRLQFDFDPRYHFDILEDKIKKIFEEAPELGALLRLYPLNFLKSLKILPVRIPLIYDAALSWRPPPESCPLGSIEYVQIATFVADGDLIIDESIWSNANFRNVDRAAILMHEAIYYALRQAFDEENSIRARALTGLIFSNLPSAEIRDRILKILRSPKSLRKANLVATFPVNLICRASVISRFDGQPEIESGKEILIANGSGAARLKGFKFEIQTRSVDHTPSSMSIFDIRSGAKNMANERMISQAFLSTSRFSLRLIRGAGPSSEALLECKSL